MKEVSLKHKKIIADKLIPFGFTQCEDGLSLRDRHSGRTVYAGTVCKARGRTAHKADGEGFGGGIYPAPRTRRRGAVCRLCKGGLSCRIGQFYKELLPNGHLPKRAGAARHRIRQANLRGRTRIPVEKVSPKTPCSAGRTQRRGTALSSGVARKLSVLTATRPWRSSICACSPNATCRKDRS